METTNDRIRERAYAKINLDLDVVGRRDDGYHLVRMVMQTLDLKDHVTVIRTDEDDVTMETNWDFIPCDDSNLIMKAAKLIRERYRISSGVHMILSKHIPAEAGLAGGSSDCAAAIRAMNKLFKLHMSVDEMKEIGVSLGADVPYCIEGGTQLSEGIGEKLTKLRDMPECEVLLVKPETGVSTGHVYRALDVLKDPAHPDVDTMLNAVDTCDLEGIAQNMENILEQVTIPEHPEIQKIKDITNGCGALNSLMSGSGPTVFALYREKMLADAAIAKIRQSGLAADAYVVSPVNPHYELGD